MDKPKNLRVLVVDDEIAFAVNIAKLLKARGFDVEAVFDGSSAIAKAISPMSGFDVVLLDMRMPDIDGLAVLRRLKSDLPSLAVIMLTGHATVETGVEAIRTGAFDYLVKPCDIEALVDKLRLIGEVERIRRRPVLWPRTTAGDIMLCDFQRLFPEDGLERVVEIFNHNRIRMAAETLFVVDRDDILQGYITPADLVTVVQAPIDHSFVTWDALREQPQWLPQRSVGTVMCRGGPFAVPQMSLAALAQLMVEHRLRSLPVVEEQRVIGVVRLRDALNHLQVSEAAEDF